MSWIESVNDHVVDIFKDWTADERPILITAPKAKIYNDAKDQRPSLIRKNKKTFSILAGKIDVAPIIFEKLLKKLNLRI